MITIHFIHNTLPSLVRRVRLPVIPSTGEAVILDGELFVVASVTHNVFSHPQINQEPYIASIYLESEKDH